MTGVLHPPRGVSVCVSEGKYDLDEIIWVNSIQEYGRREYLYREILMIIQVHDMD